MLGENIIDGTSVTVYRINDDGTMTPIYAENDGAYVTFTTDHFSTYVFTVVGGRDELNCDLDGDGDLDIDDYTLLKNYLQTGTGFENWQMLAADLNDDLGVDAFDLYILDAFINKVKALP